MYAIRSYYGTAHDVAGLVELKLEAGHDAEIAAAAAQRPEQIRILARARSHQPPVGEHHVGRDEMVDRQAEAAAQIADAAAERQSGDAGVRHDPARGR